MSSTMIKSTKFMKRAESRKSHSWWWDSHTSPKNSKWLSENLEEMDQSVKRMLKLIEEDADSFAKKAEMYYQKRPQLVSHVEEFYRMYRSLAERYDLLTGELRKNVPNSDLESQGSGISEVSSESRRKSGPRPAGFEAFLGSDDKEGDKSSESESESESQSDSDDSCVVSEEDLLRRKVTELENELQQAKEKLLERSEILSDNLGESIIDDSDKGIENFEREIAMYKTSLLDRDQEIRELKEAINTANQSLSEENLRIHGKVTKLLTEKTQLEDNLKELESKNLRIQGEVTKLLMEKTQLEDNLKELESKNLSIQGEVTKLVTEKTQLEDNLKELESKLVTEKTQLSDNLKELESNREWMEGELRQLRDGKVELEEQLKVSLKARDELGLKIEEIGADLTSKNERIKHMEWHLKEMHMEQLELVRGAERSSRKIEELEEEIEKQRVSISEGAEGKREAIRQLCFSIEHYRNDYRQLLRLAFPGQKRLQVKV